MGPACPSGPAPPHPSTPAHWLPPARCSPRPLPPRDPSARTRALPPQPWCTCCPTCPRGTPDAPDEVKPPPRNVPGAASLPSAARSALFSLQLVIPPELLLTRPPGVHPRAFARALPPAWHDPLPPGTPRREQDSALRLLKSSFKCHLPGEGSSAALPAAGSAAPAAGLPLGVRGEGKGHCLLACHLSMWLVFFMGLLLSAMSHRGAGTPVRFFPRGIPRPPAQCRHLIHLLSA